MTFILADKVSDITEIHMTHTIIKPAFKILDCMVEATTQAPDGMVEKNIPEQTYCIYLAKGKMPDAIGSTWANIWQDDAKLNRTYLADFDLYTSRAYDPKDAEVEIFVGVK